jgi:hypothetical protein
LRIDTVRILVILSDVSAKHMGVILICIVDYEPQHFISVKGFIRVAEVMGTNIGVTMAVENGTVMALACTGPG